MTLNRGEVSRILDEFKSFVLKHRVLVYVPEFHHFQTPTSQQLQSGDFDLSCWVSMVSLSKSSRPSYKINENLSSMVYVLEWETTPCGRPELPTLSVQLFDHFTLASNLTLVTSVDEHRLQPMPMPGLPGNVEVWSSLPHYVDVCDGQGKTLGIRIPSKKHHLYRTWMIKFQTPSSCTRKVMKKIVTQILGQTRLELGRIHESIFDRVPALLVARELGCDQKI
jgi:hypothetical protein